MKGLQLLAASSILAMTVSCAATHDVTGTGRNIGEDPNTSYQPPATLTSTQFGDDRRFTTTWTEWDVNRDNRLDRDEFARGTYDRLDVNRDGWISRGELEAASTIYPGFIAYENWDVDRDMRVSRDEFYNGIAAGTGTYVMWDTNRDGYLSRQELSAGAFNTWDVNRNGVIDTNEMRATDPFFRY